MPAEGPERSPSADLSRTLSPCDHALPSPEPLLLPCRSCGTSWGEDPLPPGLPRAQCGYSVVHREQGLALDISCGGIFTHSDYSLVLYHCQVIGSSLPPTLTLPEYHVRTHTYTLLDLFQTIKTHALSQKTSPHLSSPVEILKV